MSDQAFADATRPAPDRDGKCRIILRLPMLHFSLGHELLLIRERNLILFAEEGFKELPPNAQAKAIIRAVLICSRSWEENKRPVRFLWAWEWATRKYGHKEYGQAIDQFREYREGGSTFPKIVPENDQDGRKLGAPYLARLSAFACQCFGEAGFDMPLGMLQWMYFARAEADGACRIENSLERKVREEMAQHEADYAREQALRSPQN